MIYVMDVNHRNHQFIKIDKKGLTPLFKKAIKTMNENKKLELSVLLRQMLILSAQERKSKKDLQFMEELLYFLQVAERMK